MQRGTIAGEAPSRVAIVGNAPDMADQGRSIDAADWIVRFNNAAGFGGHAGRRVTHLALVNHGGQMREWLDDPTFARRPAVSAATTILFPFQPKPKPRGDQPESLPIDGRDWTREAQARLERPGGTTEILPETVQRAAEAIVRGPAHPGAAPSTGLLVTLHLLGKLAPSVRIAVHGFGFSGWTGHHWHAERSWFESLRAAGRIELHPLGTALSS